MKSTSRINTGRGHAQLIAAPLLLASAFSAASAVTYRCKGPDGTWEEKFCTGQAAPKESDLARVQREQRQDAELADFRRSSWTQLCVATEGGDVGGNCSNRHIEAYADMRRIQTDSATPEQARMKATACYWRWYKESIHVVDAVMWRYCYVND